MVIRLMKHGGGVAMALIVIAVALVACQNGEPLPVAQGPWFGLNSGQYQPAPAELQPPVKQ